MKGFRKCAAHSHPIFLEVPPRTGKEQITHFIEQANNHHATVKFTAEIAENEVTFLDTIVYEGKWFNSTSVLDVRTHFKPTETFSIYTFLILPPIRKGSGKAL